MENAVDVGSQKQLLVDNYMVEDAWNLRRTVHQPEKYSGNPVLIKEYDWEPSCPLPGTVMYDENTKEFTLYYNLYDINSVAIRKKRGSNVGHPPAHTMCIAKSKDGIRWDKSSKSPLIEHPGTNKLYDGYSDCQGSCVVRMEDAPPEKRFVLLYLDWLDIAKGGLCFAFSPDGINWKPYEKNPLIFGHSDTRNCLFWDRGRKLWTIIMRPWDTAGYDWVKCLIRKEQGSPPDSNAGNVDIYPDEMDPAEWDAKGYNLVHRHVRRRIAIARSKDLYTWSEPSMLIYPDELDPDDLYGMPAFYYEGIYFGQLFMYYHKTKMMDVQLAWSRDCVRWERHPARPAFIPLGETGKFDSYMILTAENPVRVGNEMWFYYLGYDTPHDSADATRAGVGLAKLRLDGFVSRDADREPGMLLTKPIIVKNDKLFINVNSSDGGLKVAIVEPDAHVPGGKVLDGFDKDDCDVINKDSVDCQVTWKGSPSLERLKGKRVRLKFWLKNASLYAFQLRDA